MQLTWLIGATSRPVSVHRRAFGQGGLGSPATQLMRAVRLLLAFLWLEIDGGGTTEMVRPIAASRVWRGMRNAIVGATIGCTAFFLVEWLLWALQNEDRRPEIFGGAAGTSLLMACVASVFSMPFSALGGAVLGWILERADWTWEHVWKARLAGCGVAAIVVASMFWFGAPLLLCGHGVCSQKIENGEFSRAGGLLTQRLILALAIGSIVGLRVGGRLVRNKE